MFQSLCFIFLLFFSQTQGNCPIQSETDGLFSKTAPSPRIIVTGGAGFIGSHLVSKLVQLYSVDQVVVIDSLVKGKLKNLRELSNSSHLRVCVTDLTDPEKAFSSIRGADVIFHLATVAPVDGVDDLNVYRTNNLLDQNVLSAAIRSGAKRYIYTGTVWDSPNQTAPFLQINPITDPSESEASHGWSKLIGEYQAHLAHQSGKIEVGVLRFHNVFGSRCGYSDQTSEIIPALVYQALRGGNGKGELIVDGDYHQRLDFLHVFDAVSALVFFSKNLDSPIVYNETIQIGSGKGEMIREVAQFVSETTFSRYKVRYHKKKLRVLSDRSKPMRARRGISDNTAAHQVLGWEPRVSFHKGMRMLIFWINKQMGRIKSNQTIEEMPQEGGIYNVTLLRESYLYHPIPRSEKVYAVWFTNRKPKKRTSSYSYYYELHNALKAHSALGLCNNFQMNLCTIQKQIVVIFPTKTMTTVELMADAFKVAIANTIRIAGRRKVVFAILLNKVYQNLDLKIKALSPLLDVPNSFTVVFSWSPRVVEWLDKIPLEKRDRISFHFLPFGVNLTRFDLRKEKKRGAEYDMYFAGDTASSKYHFRGEIVKLYGTLSKQYGIRFNDPNKFLNLERYRSAIANSKMTLSTVGMPGWLDLVSTRYFETMASGTTVLLCDRSPILSIYEAAGIKHGETALFFQDVAEFVEKIPFYSAALGQPNHTFSHIPKNALELTKRLHSWENRASFFLKTLLDKVHNRN